MGLLIIADEEECGCAEGTEAIAAGGVATLAALAALPLVSPLVQIWLLAEKSKQEIEDIVRMMEPLQVSFISLPIHIDFTLKKVPNSAFQAVRKNVSQPSSAWI